MKIRARLLCLALACCPWAPAIAQEESEAQRTEEVFGVETSRVLLDVVVRDKKDRPIKDLEAADFDVYEDSVLQDVDLFTIVGDLAEVPETAEEPPEAAPEEPVDREPALEPDETEPEAMLIALIFDRLSPSARHNAKLAALTYLEGSRRPDDRVGVFAIDLSLLTLQSYTDDLGAIRRGIEQAGSMATSTHDSNRGRQRDLAASTQALEAAAAPAGGSGAGAGAGAQTAGQAAGAAAVQAQLNGVQIRMARTAEVMERDQQGYATTNGLLAVVNSLGLMPGRKTVVFFSEGLSIPPAVQAHFSAVISEANRSNVSIYTMDAAGLRTQSVVAETRREMLAAAQNQMRQRASGRDVTSGAMMKDLERNEDLLRLNPHSGLGELARDTGGFLISETNDLGAGFGRISDDMRFYYVLAYGSSNPVLDGRFRKIEVKVRRPGTRVRARKGYYAIEKQPDEVPVLPFEAPALARLDRARSANAFPVRALGLTFPQPEHPGLVPILVEIPGGGIRFDSAEDDSYQADFAIVVRIRDATQRVVDRLSQSYQISGPWEQVEAARSGEVLFYREAQLAPGSYTIEAIAYDALAQSASVRTARVEVARVAADQLRLSSVFLVKRAEEMTGDDRDAARPLAFGDIIVYPNMGEPVSKTKQSEATFFFTIYSARRGADAPRARLEVYQNGAKLAEAPTPLPEPDASGQIRHVCGLPVGQFPVGEYDLRVAVEDDRGSDLRSVSFTVEN